MTALESAGGPGMRPGDRRRAPKLDGLRGLMALGVVVYHVAFIAGITSVIQVPGDGFLGTLADGLAVCLPPFFVLSGLLLYRPFVRATLGGGHRPAVRSFFWRRALRILPAYWLVALAVMLLINYDTIHGAWDLLRPLLLLHFFVTNGQFINGMEQTWTVPTEVSFYLVLPLIGWLIDRYARGAADPARRARRILVPLGLLVLVTIGWTVYIFLPSMAPHLFVYGFWPMRYAGYFAIGMALATLSAYAEVSQTTPALYRLVIRWPNACWVGALVVYFLDAPTPFGTPGVGDYPALIQEMVATVLLLVFSALLIGPLTVPNVRSRLMEGVLANPPIRFLGRISYGVYLWHVPFVYFWLTDGSIFADPTVPEPALRGTVGFWSTLAFVLGGSVVVASVSHFLVERPILRLRNRVGRTTQEPNLATVTG